MMANYTKKLEFNTAVEGIRRMIESLAAAQVADAVSLVNRGKGWNNLQGHSRCVIALAVWLVRKHPGALAPLRKATALKHSMTKTSTEARHKHLWKAIAKMLCAELVKSGSDVILPPGAKSTSPQTAQHVASTYLSTAFGGGQVGGGAGNTVLKRTLKLLAHLLQD
jgi:hypothetical protein